MSHTIRKSEEFIADFDRQFRWYFQQAGELLARRYMEAADNSLEKIFKFPNIGNLRRFPQPELHGARSFRVETAI